MSNGQFDRILAVLSPEQRQHLKALAFMQNEEMSKPMRHFHAYLDQHAGIHRNLMKKHGVFTNLGTFDR